MVQVCSHEKWETYFGRLIKPNTNFSFFFCFNLFESGLIRFERVNLIIRSDLLFLRKCEPNVPECQTRTNRTRLLRSGWDGLTQFCTPLVHVTCPLRDDDKTRQNHVLDYWWNNWESLRTKTKFWPLEKHSQRFLAFNKKLQFANCLAYG